MPKMKPSLKQRSGSAFSTKVKTISKSPVLETSPAASTSPSTLTVLTTPNPSMRKRYLLNAAGELEVESYSMAASFQHRLLRVGSLNDLAAAIQDLSRSSTDILIRGRPRPGLNQGVRRTKENFPEPEEGCSWAMLDFDGVVLPEGIPTLELPAIEFLVAKLPPCFQSASYFYQFSSSAGILRPDGAPLKQGVSAHVFFWFDRPIAGKLLSALLRKHCIDTGFFDRVLDAGGRPWIRYGVDESVLKSSVQPHYVSLPEIGPGVRCVLPEEMRQRLITKSAAFVTLPEFDWAVVSDVWDQHRQITEQWKVVNGYARRISMTSLPSGRVGITSYHAPSTGSANLRGRTLVRADTSEPMTHGQARRRFATLYFENESSPGSWYVIDNAPELARRHGDSEAVHLKELSEQAYLYVRDELRWFNEIVRETRALNEGGYLPALETFLRSRITLLIAPTGSGKSTAFCNYVRAKLTGSVVLYAAQTVALTRQMEQDLRARGFRVVHYSSPASWALLEPGVYVTTNVSLIRLVKAAKAQGTQFTLVIDEVHSAIDDFMESSGKNLLFDTALARATATILMSGTVTPLQVKKVSESVLQAVGPLTRETFSIVEFASARRFPLFWAQAQHLGADLVALMRDLAAHKAAGQPIPRTVVILGASSMRKYELLLDHFGLSEDALVVSRSEATAAEIEQARTSPKPLLLSSPLFALGLNFEFPPTRLWATVGNLQVDASQIIQTVNRANRSGGPTCEVRLYAGTLDHEPYPTLNDEMERACLVRYLQGEADAPGEIDPYLLLDRQTYKDLRQRLEKVTAKALFELQRDDSVQNYTVVKDWTDDLSKESGDAKFFAELGAKAKSSYDADIARAVPKFRGDSAAVLLLQLEGIEEKKRDYKDDNKVPKDLVDQEKALIACLLGQPKRARKGLAANTSALKRLFAAKPPLITDQYGDGTSQGAKSAAAQKSEAICLVLELLEQLGKGEVDGISFGKKMRLRTIREGIVALATSEDDFVRINRQLDKLDSISKAMTNASAAERKVLDENCFDVARLYLERIGVYFEKTKGQDGRERLDPGKPQVPKFDFDRMKLALKLQAESIRNRASVAVDRKLDPRTHVGPNIALRVCRACVHCGLDDTCALQIPNQAAWDDVEPVELSCASFAKLPARLVRLKGNLAEPGNLENSWLANTPTFEQSLANMPCSDFPILDSEINQTPMTIWIEGRQVPLTPYYEPGEQ